MSNQDSGDRNPFKRITEVVKKSEETGYKTTVKQPSDESPPVVSGRGRMLAAFAVIYFLYFLLLF